MREKVKIIANPVSGGGKGKQKLRWVRELLNARGIQPTIRETCGPDDAPIFALQAVRQGMDLVILIGGDGTMHQIVNAVIGQTNGTRFALVPTGTGNDLARELGIPPGQAGKAVNTILHGEIKPLDIAEITLDEHTTVYAAAHFELGFIADIAELTSARRKKYSKKIWPQLFYTWSGFEEFFRGIDRFTGQLTVNGKVGRFSAQSIMALNCQGLAQIFKLAPKGSPFDGQFDLCVCDFTSPKQLLLEAWRALRGKAQTIHRHPVRELEIITDQPVQAQADGEPLGRFSKFEIEVLPGALNILCPPGDR